MEINAFSKSSYLWKIKENSYLFMCNNLKISYNSKTKAVLQRK